MKLSSRSRILSISHNDLDGIGCQIVLKNYFNNIEFSVTTYNNIDEVLEKTINKLDRYDGIFITDISPNNRELFDRIDIPMVYLDHHETALDLHDPDENFYCVPEVCATKLTKGYIENMFHVKLSHLDYFVDVVNDYDMWLHRDPKSWALNELYYNYWSTKFRTRFSDGDIKFTDGEEDYIRYRRKEFNRLYTEIDFYELEDIKGVLVNTNDFANDIANKILIEEDYKIVFVYIPKYNNISVRCNETYLNIGDILKILELGGGHSNAGGFHNEDTNVISSNVEKVSKYIYENYPNMRS
jgi:oligoribonuclease NrnB/cAMP/cGMP phosphodiesterase (DHH superfamily)